MYVLNTLLLQAFGRKLCANSINVTLNTPARSPPINPLPPRCHRARSGAIAVVWSELFPAEQLRLIRLLVERVQIRDDGLDIEWHATGWSGLAGELAPNSIGAELRDLEEAAA